MRLQWCLFVGTLIAIFFCLQKRISFLQIGSPTCGGGPAYYGAGGKARADGGGTARAGLCRLSRAAPRPKQPTNERSARGGIGGDEVISGGSLAAHARATEALACPARGGANRLSRQPANAEGWRGEPTRRRNEASTPKGEEVRLLGCIANYRRPESPTPLNGWVVFIYFRSNYRTNQRRNANTR